MERGTGTRGSCMIGDSRPCPKYPSRRPLPILPETTHVNALLSESSESIRDASRQFDNVDQSSLGIYRSSVTSRVAHPTRTTHLTMRVVHLVPILAIGRPPHVLGTFSAEHGTHRYDRPQDARSHAIHSLPPSKVV